MGLITWPIRAACRWAWHAIMRFEIWHCKAMLRDAIRRHDAKAAGEYIGRLSALATQRDERASLERIADRRAKRGGKEDIVDDAFERAIKINQGVGGRQP